MDNFLNAALKVTHISTVMIKMIKFEIKENINQTEFKLHSPFVGFYLVSFIFTGSCLQSKTFAISIRLKSLFIQ